MAAPGTNPILLLLKRSGGLRSLASLPLVRKKYPLREVALANLPSYAFKSDCPTLKKAKSIQKHKLKAPSCVRIYGCNYSDMRYSWVQLLHLNLLRRWNRPRAQDSQFKGFKFTVRLIKPPDPTHSPCVTLLYFQHPWILRYSDWVISASTSQTGVVLRLGSLL